TRTEHIVSWYRDAIDARKHDARDRARG
ncbi:MAG TPA: N-acetylmannosamine-6-phosphate 2-epimerase, partial [Pelagibacterium sp.]|nr:N-acetylmannosamine-6-phosphate 2-epimerase [Pelagibacterium sp.]